jgi:hypothetical protein
MSSSLPQHLHWHRWFAWHPVIFYGRTGKLRVAWLKYVRAEMGIGHLQRFGTTMGLSHGSNRRRGRCRGRLRGLIHHDGLDILKEAPTPKAPFQTLAGGVGSSEGTPGPLVAAPSPSDHSVGLTIQGGGKRRWAINKCLEFSNFSRSSVFL